MSPGFNNMDCTKGSGGEQGTATTSSEGEATASSKKRPLQKRWTAIFIKFASFLNCRSNITLHRSGLSLKAFQLNITVYKFLKTPEHNLINLPRQFLNYESLLRTAFCGFWIHEGSRGFGSRSNHSTRLLSSPCRQVWVRILWTVKK